MVCHRNVDNADVVQQVHQDYIRVGRHPHQQQLLDLSLPYGPIGLGDEWEKYARASGENAIKARDAMNPDAYVLAEWLRLLKAYLTSRR